MAGNLWTALSIRRLREVIEFKGNQSHLSVLQTLAVVYAWSYNKHSLESARDTSEHYRESASETSEHYLESARDPSEHCLESARDTSEHY